MRHKRYPEHILLALLLAWFSIAAAAQAQSSEGRLDPSNPPDWSFDENFRPGVSDRPNHPADRFPVSLHEAFQTSHVQNPSVLEAVKNLERTRSQVLTAGARPNPQFAMQLGFGPAYNQVVAGNTQQLGVNQLFELGGKRRARLQFARDNILLAEKQLDDLRSDIRAAVRKAYAELAAAEANVELVENQRVLVERLRHITQKRVEKKLSEELDLLQAKLALESFETLRNSALARMRQASIKLNQLLGYQVDRDLDVEDNGLFKLSQKKTELVPPPDEQIKPLASYLVEAHEHRPDVKASRQQIAAAKSEIKLRKAEAIPDLLIGSGWVFTAYKKSSGYPQQPGAFLNINMDMPIFYRHQGEIAAAKVNLERSLIQDRTASSIVEMDVRLAYSSIVSARANLAHYQKVLIPLALSVIRKSHEAYENGKSDLGSTIVAQQQYQQTFSNYFETVVAYQSAWADLETAVGRKMDF